VDKKHSKLSVRRQCELLGISCSGYYKSPQKESALNETYKQIVLEKYTECPHYGRLKLTAHLRKMGHQVNPKRVYTIMRDLGISAIYAKPNTSIPRAEHKVYPYLLKEIEINKPNQVWCADITYIRVKGGFMYLVAVMDWHSRYVLSWELSNTMDKWFCVDALQSALAYQKPEVFNTDQGSQFTSDAFISVLKEKGIQISMDGKGRCIDNVRIERLWRSVKYEDIFLRQYASVADLHAGLTRYFHYYNTQRPHQALGYQTPNLIYCTHSQLAKEVAIR
jgi:putative transposase